MCVVEIGLVEMVDFCCELWEVIIVCYVVMECELLYVFGVVF